MQEGQHMRITSLFYVAALLGLPAVAIANDPPVNGCVISDLDFVLPPFEMGTAAVPQSPAQWLYIHCFDGARPDTVTITPSGGSAGGIAAFTGPGGSLVPYKLGTASQADFVVQNAGSPSRNILPELDITPNPQDDSGAAIRYGRDLYVRALVQDPAAQIYQPGHYGASALVTLIYANLSP